MWQRKDAAMEIRPPKTNDEFHQMWELNHDVFAEELHQHAIHKDHCLIDKFHTKNHYIVACENGVVQGMICVHCQPPFSAVEKFGKTIESYIVPGETGEIRLFTLRPNLRKSSTLAVQMLIAILKEMIQLHLDYIIISGVSTQKKFYEHCGMKTVGNAVQSGASYFYPMVGRVSEIIAQNKSWGRYVNES